MKVNKLNEKYKFTEPKHSFEAKGNLCKVYVYYYLDGKRQVLKYSDGLNTKYFTVTKDLSKKEITKRAEERLRLITAIKDNYLDWIANREFNSITKAFELPSNQLPLLDYYNMYLEHKTKQSKSKGTISQYKTKLNLFKQYLLSNKMDKIKVDKFKKQNYIDYFQSLVQNKSKDKKQVTANWHNSVVTFHRMVWNFIVDVKELELKHPLKTGIDTKEKQDIEIHTAIPTQYVMESFQQLEQYGSEILMLYCQFIFYSLHRGDTLVQLQLKEIDLDAGIIHIPASKIKTKSKVDLQMQPYLIQMLKSYIQVNEVKPNEYLFGYELVESVRGTKKQYKLFGTNQSNRANYTDKFDHFIEKQIVKAYNNNPSLTKIFLKGKNSSYGYKHTGVVFLRQNNWTKDQIIELTGHKDTEILTWYERDYKPELPQFPSL